MNPKILMVARILLGLALAIFGANKFFDFMPAPKPVGDIKTFFDGLTIAGFMTLIGAVEVVVGLLLIANKWVGFAITALVPLSVGFIMFHLALAPAGIVPALVVVVLHLVLLLGYKEKLKPLFS